MKALSRRFRALRACLPLLLASLLGMPALAKQAGDAEVPGEVLVRLQSTAHLQALMQKYSLSLRSQFGSRPIYRLSVVGAASTHDVIAALALEPGVLDAEPNYIHTNPEARQNVAWAIGAPAIAYVAQWAPQAMRLAQAQTMSRGAGVRVAVLDTGVDAAHPALASRLLPGFDFVDFDTNPAEVGAAGLNISYGHGTHVAGLVALAAPDAKIMPLRVLDVNGQGNAWVLAEAMLYAIDPDGNPATPDGAQVINMSLGSLSRTHLFDAVTTLVVCAIPAVTVPGNGFTDPGYNSDRARCDAFGGAAVVAAAGNDASKSVRQYPAAEGAYGLLPVTASAPTGRLAAFANYGSWVDVAAPGEGITSSMVGGGYATWSGTSMAAPLASGTAALLRAYAPGLSAQDVVRRIARTGAPLCGTKLLQVDAAAALLDQKQNATCP